jgi:ATP citrate (pro-S)-lyase
MYLSPADSPSTHVRAQIMECPQIRTVAIIAEGVPERRTRTLIRMAKELRVTLIGPATVR